MKKGDKVKARVEIVNAETFEMFPMNQIFVIIDTRPTHSVLVHMGYSKLTVKVDYEPKNFYFSDAFELVKTVGFIIE